MSYVEPASSSWRDHAAYNSGVMALVGAIGALLVALFNTGNTTDLPVFASGPGQVSVAGVLILTAGVMGAVVTSYTYRGLFLARKEAREVVRLAEERRGRSVLVRFLTSFGVGVLFAFSLALVFFVLYPRLDGAQMNRAGVILLTTTLGTGLSYLTAYWVITVRPRQLFRLAFVLLVISLLMGMASVADEGWWRVEMGYLGYPTYAELLLALGILIGCLLVLSVAMDVIADLRVLVDIDVLPGLSFDRLKFGLYAASLGVAGIGLLPAYVDPWANALYALSVLLLSVLVVIGLLASPWLNPHYPRGFRLSSWIAGAGVLALLVAWLVFGWINFIAWQLLLLLIALAWVFIYQYHTTQFVMRHRPALVAEAEKIKAEPVP